MNLRLYFDEDSSDRALGDALRARGVDVLTAVEANKVEITDEEQLAWATAQGRSLYSFNVSDFYRIHSSILERRGEEHGGIILARQQIYSVGEQMRRLLKLGGSIRPEQMKNRVEFLSAWG